MGASQSRSQRVADEFRDRHFSREDLFDGLGVVDDVLLGKEGVLLEVLADLAVGDLLGDFLVLAAFLGAFYRLGADLLDAVSGDVGFGIPCGSRATMCWQIPLRVSASASPSSCNSTPRFPS